MTADVQSAGVAAKARGIFVSPCNSTPHLVGHNAYVTIRGTHRNKIECDIIYASIDKEFGWESVILRFSAKPSTAVYEYKDRRVGFLGRIYIQCFDRCRPVCEPLRGTNAGARLIAARRVAF